MDSTELAVLRIGSLNGSAVVTNTSSPGSSDVPPPAPPPARSNRCRSAARSGTRLIGFSFGSWSSSHEKPNQNSPAIDVTHSHSASGLRCEMRQITNSVNAISRTKISTL
uniref:Uncharacterized protein n=1 Tax=Zea mays TaxID=4577 RepID=B7ZYX1_MAIZE|nr:unknown [Zea mays]